eukprot:CAMPEP_0202072546 /NCGR_PEP_ID=MMETSP0964-20121228/2489_1 /ASSEMBLY_ACC=CAM_ASM_000500 /TAXON_ID=4773 /ORGANISM="Schizochytrium aggregatum, Strain ATCC28209" /LENGTH=152 /DNA_ID=CAMNT_0048639587 /DNA_START=40 /DNA_END=498 /DNA_ORIENTATION=+
MEAGPDAKLVLKAKVYNALLVVAGGLFWVLALNNIVSGRAPQDGGIAIFLFPFFAGVTGFMLLAGKQKTSCFIKTHFLLVAFGVFFSVVGFVGGAIGNDPNDPDAFNLTFLIIMALVWAALGAVVTLVAWQFRNALLEEISSAAVAADSSAA